MPQDLAAILDAAQAAEDADRAQLLHTGAEAIGPRRGRVYDPRQDGARCDECVLRDQIAVPGEIRPGAKLLVVGEAPGSNEEERGVPFVGASGKELERAIGAAGFTRMEVSLDNALGCRPPGGMALKTFLRRQARKARQEGRKAGPTPIECCRPRLIRRVQEAPALLLVGAAAVTAVAGDQGGEKGLLRMRGFPIQIAGKPAVLTFHPAHVLRQRRWTETFRSDVAKAFRHATGRLTWGSCAPVWDPAPERLAEVLEAIAAEAGSGRVAATDTETDGRDPEACGLRCVGVASESGLGVVAGFASVPAQGVATKWRCPPEVARSLLQRFYADLRIRGRLALQNRIFDERVLARCGMDLPDRRQTIDTMVAHHVVEGELPHDLDYLSSRYTDAPKHKPTKWKKAHEAWASDKELHAYNFMDCVVTALLARKIATEVVAGGLQRVYKSDVELQRMCMGMHRAGMAIDEGERRRHARRLWQKAQGYEAEAKAAAGVAINPRSADQVRTLLYEDWALPWPTIETAGGDPSTDKDALYELLVRDLPAKAARFVVALIDYRSAMRSLAKDVLRAGEVPSWLAGFFDDEDDEDPRKSGLKVGSDGRVRPYWSGTTGVTGRPQSSDPNCSNVPSTRADPDSLRSMYVASPGNVLVACDHDQAEFRGIALLSGSDKWLRVFEAGGDPHTICAKELFGIEIRDKKDPKRAFAKNLRYAIQYGAWPPTILMQLRRVRDHDGSRPYSALDLKEVQRMRSRALANDPALEAYWKAMQAAYRAQGYLRSPILGRVRRFLDARGKDPEELASDLANYPVQSMEADVMSGEGACAAVMEGVGWPWDTETRGRGLGGPGVIHHNYDSIMVEVAEGKAEEAAAVLEGAMIRVLEWEGRKVKLPAKAKAGKRWSDV